MTVVTGDRTRISRPMREFRVRLHTAIRTASIARADAPLLPMPTTQATVSAANQANAPLPSLAAEQLSAPEYEAELRRDREHIEAVLSQLKPSIERLREEQAHRLGEWQRAAIELAMTLATRLLHQKIENAEFPMEAKVRDMIAQLQDDAPATLYLNPRDVEILESRLNGSPLLPGRDDPRVIADASLGRGECRIEGSEGMLVSDLTRELQEIRDELLRSLAHARS